MRLPIAGLRFGNAPGGSGQTRPRGFRSIPGPEAVGIRARISIYETAKGRPQGRLTVERSANIRYLLWQKLSRIRGMAAGLCALQEEVAPSTCDPAALPIETPAPAMLHTSRRVRRQVTVFRLQ